MKYQTYKEFDIGRNVIQCETEGYNLKMTVTTILSNIRGVPIDIIHTLLNNKNMRLEGYWYKKRNYKDLN